MVTHYLVLVEWSVQQSEPSTLPSSADGWCISAPRSGGQLRNFQRRDAGDMWLAVSRRSPGSPGGNIKEVWMDGRRQCLQSRWTSTHSRLEFNHETCGSGCGVRADCGSGWRECGSSAATIWLCTEDSSNRWAAWTLNCSILPLARL